MKRRSGYEKGRRSGRPKSAGSPGSRLTDPDSDADLEPLTREQIREIERRLRNLDDPTRYVLVSDFGPRFKLYYEISDGVYVMNEPARATLFKSREAALAVRATLGPGIQIVRCKTRMKDGVRIPILTRRKGRRKERRASRSRRTG